MIDLTPTFVARSDLIRTAMYYLRNRADAEDAVQDAFLCAVRYRGQVRDEVKLVPWMHVVVANCARMAIEAQCAQKRGGGKQTLSIEELPERGGKLPARMAPRWWLDDPRWHAIERLSSAKREMVEALVIDRMPLKEYGAMVGRKHQTVKTDIYRLRKRLQREVAR